ncbi:MAG: response regulator [Chitinophagaceae bacterium]
MPPGQAPQDVAPPQNSSRFILLGEDDIDDEELLKEIFLTIDPALSLVFVNNGRKILTALGTATSLPCLIVLDYNMPELNGAEMLAELEKDPRYDQVPKIIWSTSGAEKYKNLCLGLGARDYITKPSSVRELTEAARYMLSFCR